MPNYNLYSDQKLMKEIKAGNMLAFDALYKKYCKSLYKFVFSIIKSAEEAENIIQDVFLNLWLNRNNIQKEALVKYYIFTIAYNSTISVIRRKIKESQFIEELKNLQIHTQESVESEIEYNEMNEKLNEIINTLPERQKEVYLLHKAEGLKYSEIADRLNISVNTVENHMSRALKTIRDRLGNY
mgnify:CR=1 FL=1